MRHLTNDYYIMVVTNVGNLFLSDLTMKTTYQSQTSHIFCIHTYTLDQSRDSRMHGIVLSIETSHHLSCKFSITLHGVTAGDLRWRREADTFLVN